MVNAKTQFYPNINLVGFAGFSSIGLGQLLDAGSRGQDAYILIGFFILGLTFGQSSGAVSSRFTQYYRYTGAALTSDLAWLVGAAFAPLVALGLASSFGIIFIGGYLISGAICTLAALTLTRALDQQ